jgi:hypothetical protein
LHISNIGISWSSAKIAAQASSYYAEVIFSHQEYQTEEAQIYETSLVLDGLSMTKKREELLMTGPEIGLVFWTGAINGSAN